ncbi:MAG TPA: hypothetical protein VF691_13950 [Cytophagaceae bacterium]|jgi:hypothetical protein
MTDRNLKTIFGTLSAVLLATLFFKLTNVPGGMILSGLALGGMMIVVIILGCLLLTGILRLIIKQASFLTIFSITTFISFLAFHYQLYSPTLTIKVPNGFKGEVNLVLSNVNDNILTIDTNGIGYLNKWTFSKTYLRPIVMQLDGKNLDKYLVGFNQSSFFGRSSSAQGGIRSLSFKIVLDSLTDEDYYTFDWMNKVDKKLILSKDVDE